MKVLHLIAGLSRGGAETMLARLVPRFDFGNIVVSLMDEGELGPEIRAAGVPLFALGLGPRSVSLGALAPLRRIIRAQQPDLLQTWLYRADFLALLVSMLPPRVPIVWNLRCSDMDLVPGARVMRWLLARASSMPAAVIANSESGRRFHEKLGYRPKCWEMIPNGFDTDRFRPDSGARAEVRRSLGLDDRTPLIGMVARVDPMKDYGNFLAAAERVAIARPDAHFLLVGRGTETLSVPSGLTGRLNALGSRGDIPRLLAALDVLVLSSAFGEGFPNVIGEAMACGVPCVATDVGDTAAVIGATGIVVPRRDPAALSRGVIDVLSRGKDVRARARQRIVDHYGLAAIAERYRTLYESLISSRQSAAAA
jgi:glycosyltransferase involved in cell wall biosynthesis